MYFVLEGYHVILVFAKKTLLLASCLLIVLMWLSFKSVPNTFGRKHIKYRTLTPGASMYPGWRKLQKHLERGVSSSGRDIVSSRPMLQVRVDVLSNIQSTFSAVLVSANSWGKYLALQVISAPLCSPAVAGISFSSFTCKTAACCHWMTENGEMEPKQLNCGL